MAATESNRPLNRNVFGLGEGGDGGGEGDRGGDGGGDGGGND